MSFDDTSVTIEGHETTYGELRQNCEETLKELPTELDSGEISYATMEVEAGMVNVISHLIDEIERLTAAANVEGATDITEEQS